MPATISHWMNNAVFPGTSVATAPVTNPATGAVTAEVVLGSVEDSRAVGAARRGPQSWPSPTQRNAMTESQSSPDNKASNI